MRGVANQHNATAATYCEQHDESSIITSGEHLANYYRLNRVKQRILASVVTSIFHLGIRDGSTLAAIVECGRRVGGSDPTEGMLGVAKAHVDARGFYSSLLTLGDIRYRSTSEAVIATRALKPGMMGLWRVDGLSDLSWGKALEFKSHHAETWALSGDRVLLAKTACAVFQSRDVQ